MEKVAFAFFDFDDTIARGDSIVPYMLYCMQRGMTSAAHVARSALKFISAKLGRCTVEEAKRFALSFLAGQRSEDVEAVAHAFWREKLLGRCYADALREMERCRAEGKQVLVVSASITAYMDLLPAYLPADGVIATVTGVDPDGRYNGLLGENCRGLQKPLRIAEYIAANSVVVDYASTCAYGDSMSDIPMLSQGAHKTLVNPGAKLRKTLPEARVVRWR